MAYSNVKKPAFYIPIFDYFHSIGHIDYPDPSNLTTHFLNPTKTTTSYPAEITGDDNWWQGGFLQMKLELKGTATYNAIADDDGYIYLFVLGHNFASTDCSINVVLGYNNTEHFPTVFESVVNSNGTDTDPTYNGFSIIKMKYVGVNLVDTFKIRFYGHSSDSNNGIKIGCVSLCNKWTPPHNPDLSLTMSREYDGVKTTRTKGGATLSNASYTRGGTYWTNGYPWELYTGDYEEGDHQVIGARTLGRRIWSMNFSYLSPANLMPEFESLNWYETEYQYGGGINLKESQSFFARVLNRVQGSHLPFIFQPNDTDNNTNPDQWAIVRFDQKDFKITQSAPELYSLSMKLTESW